MAPPGEMLGGPMGMAGDLTERERILFIPVPFSGSANLEKSHLPNKIWSFCNSNWVAAPPKRRDVCPLRGPVEVEHGGVVGEVAILVEFSA
jgi:hypothetical protein